MQTLSKIAVSLSLLGVLALSSACYAQNEWWARENEGWFFYNYNPETEQDEPKRSAPEPEPIAAAPDELYTDRMTRVGKELMSKAMEDPTEDNVRAFMEYNKAMLVSSNNFSVAWQKVLMKYPHLLTEGGLKYAHEDIKDAVSDLGRKAGLYFFHSSTCPACQKQAVALKDFEAVHGNSITIFPITMDAPLPEYPSAALDNGISSTLGLTVLPSIYIAFPGEGKIDLISEGLIDKFDLERRLMNYAKPIDRESVETYIANSGSGVADNMSDR